MHNGACITKEVESRVPDPGVIGGIKRKATGTTGNPAYAIALRAATTNPGQLPSSVSPLPPPFVLMLDHTLSSYLFLLWLK